MWERHVRDMRSRTSGIDWSNVDFSKLTAKDIGVHLGPPMTKEQFDEYRKRNKDVRVISQNK